MAGLSKEVVQEVLHYDPDSGVFTWRERAAKHFKRGARDAIVWNKRFAGKVAGGDEYHGYERICVQCRRHKSHRLAFIYMLGHCPKEVDHIDGDRKNNAWMNLRGVTRSENNKNTSIRSDSTSGITGVSWSPKRRKWQCYINEGPNIRKSLGLFDNLIDAAAARLSAEKRNGYHPNHGKSPPAAR